MAEEQVLNTHNAEILLSAANKSHYPQDDLPEVALAGRSNVGKSSFINTLLGRKNLARTSGKPGKTQLLNFYNIDDKLRFVDVPGYGYARVSKKERAKWGKMWGEKVGAAGRKRSFGRKRSVQSCAFSPARRAMPSAAVSPVSQAAVRLKPPVSPSMSSTSPAKNSPGTCRLSIVLGDTDLRLTPPHVTNSPWWVVRPVTA